MAQSVTTGRRSKGRGEHAAPLTFGVMCKRENQKPMARIWELLKSNESLGILELQDIDQPWFMFSFQPTDVFSNYKGLFEEELVIEDP